MPPSPITVPLSPTSVGEYNISSHIGRGSFANVYKGFKKRGHYEVVAIKCIQISSLSRTSKNNLFNEINILKKIKHEHIVEMNEFTWDSRNIYLIFEYCPGGNLAEFIETRKTVKPSVLKHFVQQLALGLQHLHSENIVHCDLKPENILLSTPPVGSLRSVKLKIADFGFSQIINSEHGFTHGLKGSPLYMAPEILRQQLYDAKADLYSLGVIIYECLFGQTPFRTDDFQSLIEQILSFDPIKIPSTVNIPCQTLLRRLLVKDPSERMSFKEFFKHEFVDLKHCPTDENYQKGVDLINQAVIEDTHGNYQDAAHCYTEGLLYLVPAYNWLDSFNDIQRRSLHMRIKEYVSRAEKIKQQCYRFCHTP